MFIQLAPRTHVGAPALSHRAERGRALAVAPEVVLQRGPRHGPVAVGVIWAHDSQTIQQLPERYACLSDVNFRPHGVVIQGTALPDVPEVAPQTEVAERVAARSVYWIEEGLPAESAHQGLVDTRLVLVYVVRTGRVTLPA